MITSFPQLSEKTKNFFEYVKNETGKPIQIQQSKSVGLQGMNFAFTHDPSFIILEIVLPFGGSIDQFENSLAHEACHGLLTYSRGYVHLKPVNAIKGNVSFSLSVIGTMVDDVPVNKLIQDYGFRAYGENYLRMVKREGKFASKGDRTIYNNTGPDEESRKRFMIYRYVAAWTYLQYFIMNSLDRSSLQKFRKSFSRAYPDIGKEGSNICECFKKYDVFSKEGHEEIIKKVLCGWNLDEFVLIERYS
jgi:hypothetical protein